MKKLIILLIAILLLTSGCSSEKYQLIKEGEEYYILYNASSSQSSHMEVEYAVFFNSMKEMKDAIANVDFTEEQLEEFAKRLRKQDQREGKLHFLNIDNLYEPIYPSDLKLTVKCMGRSYQWILTNSTGSKHISMSPHMGQYRSERETVEAYIKSLEDEEILSVTNISDRNSTAIEYIDGHGNNVKSIYYKIETGEKNLIVLETVYLNEISEDNKIYFKDKIQIYGEQSGNYFSFSIFKTDERPSVEWLSQFGIKEYVDP